MFWMSAERFTNDSQRCDGDAAVSGPSDYSIGGGPIGAGPGSGGDADRRGGTGCLERQGALGGLDDVAGVSPYASNNCSGLPGLGVGVHDAEPHDRASDGTR